MLKETYQWIIRRVRWLRDQNDIAILTCGMLEGGRLLDCCAVDVEQRGGARHMSADGGLGFLDPEAHGKININEMTEMRAIQSGRK